MTRAFFRPKGSSLELLVIEKRPRGITLGRGNLHRSPPRRTTKRSFASTDEATRAFEGECERRLGEGWTEIRALLEEQYFDPPIGAMLDAKLKMALIDTARGWKLPPLKKKAAAPKVRAAVRSRGEELTALVARRDRIRVEGELVLPTGRLVAADPMLVGEAPPFERALRKGSYPVVLAMKDGLVAAASIVVARGAPERWELALPKGMKRLVPPKLRVPSATPGYVYPVDSATGSFMDACVASALHDDDRTIARLIGPRAKNRCHRVGREGGTVAVFQSGRGDGQYATYFGLRGRDVVCVTTDFGP